MLYFKRQAQLGGNLRSKTEGLQEPMYSYHLFDFLGIQEKKKKIAKYGKDKKNEQLTSILMTT